MNTGQLTIPSLFYNTREERHMKFLEQFYFQFYRYKNGLISEKCVGKRNPLYQVVYDLQLRHAGTLPPQPWALFPNTRHTAVPC